MKALAELCSELTKENARVAEVNAELLDILGRLIEADKHGALDDAMFAYAEKFVAKAKEQQ